MLQQGHSCSCGPLHHDDPAGMLGGRTYTHLLWCLQQAEVCLDPWAPLLSFLRGHERDPGAVAPKSCLLEKYVLDSHGFQFSGNFSSLL